MLLTDYFRAAPDLTWSMALQSGVRHGTIRLPEDDAFDVTSLSHVKVVTDRFRAFGIEPVIVEPLPNALHDHIKLGDGMRDVSVQKFIRLMENLHEVGIGTVCFNFMAHYGWTRTASDLPERGDAKVTGFSLDDFRPDDFTVSREQIRKNYESFIRDVLPYARRYDIRLALHPDDPPLPALGGVGRIFTSLDAINRAVRMADGTADAPYLGVTFCQACYHLMGEDLEQAIKTLSDKIFFIHFRNVRGEKTHFSETFHDNGEIDMADAIRLYRKYGVDVPIRVDHVPTLAGEEVGNAGYDVLGRLFAIGYLKGLLEANGIPCDQ